MTTLAGDLRRARRLEFFTLGWNLIEALVSVIAGALAGSVALVGFGVDSLIESASGATLLWRLQDGGEARERLAQRLVGVSFLLLAGYVGIESARALIEREPPEATLPGILIAALSLLVMPWLARQKCMLAGRIDSGALAADSRQTSLCAWLSAILLVGLAMNAFFGWWWADPVAGLLMVPIILREAYDGLRGRACACH